LPFPVPYPVPVWGGGGGYYGGTTVIQPVPQAAIQPAEPIDLELLEVRQLDRGDVANNIGPAFRVTLRDKSGEMVRQAFDVALAASIGRQPTADAAFATARVKGLQAGQTLAIELRMPAKALNIGLNADGQPVPFSWLTAVVDNNQEVQEATRDNNFVVLNRGEIVMMVQN
jgi:hypothetical protein